MNSALLVTHFDRISEAPDAIPRLRGFILDLAVRGQLVEQQPYQESAERLMNRIRAAKGLLNAAEGIETVAADDRPFEIPTDWIWVRLGEICSKTGSGSTPRGGKAVYQQEGVPFLRSQNVHNDGLHLDDVAYITAATHEKMSGTALQSGDLLLNITGGSIGRSCIVPPAIGDANVSQHVAIIRPAIAGLERYVHQLILSPYFQSFVMGEQTGAGRGGLPKNRMDRIPVALPPLSEQQRIVAKVDELMTFCDQLEAANRGRKEVRIRLSDAARLSLADGVSDDEVRRHGEFYIDHLADLTRCHDQIPVLRKTVLNLAVQGRLISQDPQDRPVNEILEFKNPKRPGSEPFPIPASWMWVSMAQVAECRLGKMLDNAKNKGTPRRYLRNVNVRWFDFDLSDVFEMRFEDDEIIEFALRRGDVLICEGGEPGRAAVWDCREEDIYFQKAIHRARFSEHVVPEYFVYALRQSTDSGRLPAYFTGVAIKHLTGKGLSSLAFPLPPRSEQERIVKRVRELMNLCNQLETQLSDQGVANRKLLESVLFHALAESTTS